MILTSPWPEPDVPAVTLTEYVRSALAGRPAGAPALVDGLTGRVLTVGALDRAITAAAGSWTGAGIGPVPGDGEVGRRPVVALVSPNRPEWPVALHGALSAGAAVALCSPMGTAGELAAQLRLAGAVAVVADPGVEDTVRRAASLAGVGTVRLIDALDDATPPPADPAAPAPVDPAAVAVMPFSSGTTGLPKAVQLTHRNLVANLEQHRVIQHLGPDDVLCAVIPFSHSYGLTLVLHTALVHGATLVTLPRFDLDAYVDIVETRGVTRLFVAPPVLRALAGLPAGAERRLASVQVAICGAAPLDPALAGDVRERFGFPVVQGYGMTEASPGTHFTPDDRWDRVPAGSVGWLVPGTEGRITPFDRAGADDGRVTGELWIRGPQVMAGYLGVDAATAEAVDGDGWLRSGDVVSVDDQGCFYVVDRIKELVKYKGHQVAPAELEALLCAHPAVRDAAVVGVVVDGDEWPKAFVVGDGVIDADALMAWVAERVAPYKKIRLVEQVGEIPRSPAGKILRRLLRDGQVTAAQRSGS